MKNIAFIGLVLLASCQTQTSSPSGSMKEDSIIPTRAIASDTTTLGGKWYLQPVLPSDTAAGKTPSIDFDLGHSRFAGNTGCNPMHGEFYFSDKDSSLSFNDKIISGRMSCTGYNEAAFMKSLRSAGRFRLNNGILTLLSDDNTELSHWTRKRGSGPKALKA